MSEAFDQFQQALLADNSRYAHTILQQQLAQSLSQHEPITRARTQMLLRLSQAVQQFTNPDTTHKTGTADLIVLVRQVIRHWGRTLDLPREWWELIQFRTIEAGLFYSSMSDKTVTIHARPWQPLWLPQSASNEIEHLTYCRAQQPVLGDGMLAALTNGHLSTYLSEGQKAAVDRILFAPPGTSLLATLPTGGGKSLCILLPAWLASGGGRYQGGTTIVVVPTVSLAIDQQSHVVEAFRTSVGLAYRPYALLGDTGKDVRATIYQGIRDGTLPILYTSPESLINNAALHETVLEAASKGFVNWLVIDEAHLVEHWGAGFRTEFQLLAALRQQLLTLSKGSLRTLLLSATVSQQSWQTLTELFGDGRDLSTVTANQLRPEISYWLSTAPTQEQRQSRVLEALYNLPRPAILYVTRPADAEEWVSYLRRQGFERLAAYTGKTAPIERTQIMREWIRNERDLIVATSAFGLGVDKEDVRTVIHATLPENVDRFYQEVGRGGRDGCRSISLLCVIPEDLPLARNMSLRSRITVEKAWPRWQAMWLKRQSAGGGGAHYFVDLEAAPPYNPEMDSTDTHRNWNEHILLLMQRAGAIRIISSKPIDSSIVAVNCDTPQRRWLHIELVNPAVTYSEEDYAATFEPQRQRERNYIRASLSKMHDLTNLYSNVRMDRADIRCLGQEFLRTYPRTSYACGSCPACREYNYPSISAVVRVDVDFDPCEPVLAPTGLIPVVQQLFMPQPHLHVIWDGIDYPFDSLAILLPRLLQSGFTQYVLATALAQSSDWYKTLINSLWRVPSMPRHRILSDDMITGNSLACWSLQLHPTVVIYPKDPKQADDVYRTVKTACMGQPLVQIVHRQLYLPSEHGRFLEKVNGRHILLNSFADQLQDRLQTL